MQPLLQWKSSKYYVFRVCVSSLRCQAWNAHAPYYHLWSVRFYKFRHEFRGKKFIEHKMCFNFLYKFVWKFLNSKNWVRYLSRGSQVVPYGQTDMAKLIFALWKFANVPKNESGYEFKRGEWSFHINATRAHCRVLNSGVADSVTLLTSCMGCLYSLVPSLSQNRISVFAEYNQQDAKFLNFFVPVRRSTCFRRFFRPS